MLNPRQFPEGTYEVKLEHLLPYRQHSGTSDYHKQTYQARTVHLAVRSKNGPTVRDGNHALEAARQAGAQYMWTKVTHEP